MTLDVFGPQFCGLLSALMESRWGYKAGALLQEIFRAYKQFTSRLNTLCKMLLGSYIVVLCWHSAVQFYGF